MRASSPPSIAKAYVQCSHPGPLIQSINGDFYGTSNGGGAAGLGTVFTFGPPTVTLLPTSLSFGNQVLDTTSTAKSLRVKNSGTGRTDY